MQPGVLSDDRDLLPRSHVLHKSIKITCRSRSEYQSAKLRFRPLPEVELEGGLLYSLDACELRRGIRRPRALARKEILRRRQGQEQGFATPLIIIARDYCCGCALAEIPFDEAAGMTEGNWAVEARFEHSCSVEHSEHLRALVPREHSYQHQPRYRTDHRQQRTHA